MWSMWSLSYLLAILAESLAAAAKSRDAEHAVTGLDALSEVQMHPILAEALGKSGFGVLREQRLPGIPAARPADRERERCDLVLLASPDASLEDPVHRLREQDRAAGTLFDQHERRRPNEGVAPEVAFWLEVKVVGQFVVVDGAAVPNRAYASQLVSAISQDVRKLAQDRYIERSALLLVLFTADEATARHDLTMALHRCLDRDVPIGHPEIEQFSITDRIGNTSCLLVLVPARPIRPLGEEP